MSQTNKPLPPPSPSSGSAKAGAPRPPAAEAPQSPGRPTWVLPVVIGAFVVGLAVVVAAGGLFGSDSKSSTVKAGPATSVAGAAGTASSGAGSGVAGETQPVTVGTGNALAKLGGNNAADPAVGQKPPTLTGSSFDGTPVTITPGGSPKLILFVAHWCPHCQREVPKIAQWIASGGAPKDLQIEAVSTAVSKDNPNYPPSAWLAKVGFTKPVLADDEAQSAAKAWGLPGYPYFVLLKADGSVAKRYSGEIEITDLNTLIAKALAQ